MKTNEKEYSSMVAGKSKKSRLVKDTAIAFLTGGAICVLGQLIMNLYKYLGFEKETAQNLMSITLIFLASLFTGFKIFDNLAKYAGAGTLVPITGFSNAITSPAMEFKSEGMILGVGAKIFTIAGPVIAYGTIASILYGIVYYIILMMNR